VSTCLNLTTATPSGDPRRSTTESTTPDK
jgi:hypothetical protein